MPEKILMVDDEDAVLVGYQRMFRNEFQIETAPGGAAALAALEATGPYAVVVSDMRMPEMDGAKFLTKVKVFAPDTIRIMLTGDADVRSAVTAVNEGSIFRFLTKALQQRHASQGLDCGIDAVPAADRGERPVGKHAARQHPGAHRGTQPGQPGSLRPGPAGAPLYPSGGYANGSGQSLEI